MVQGFTVRLNRQHTYRHLYALCQNDTLFAISDYDDKWKDKDFERIVISDQQMLRRNNQTSARGAIIGTVRLLPYGDATTVMFVNKDAFWHEPISETGKALFVQFTKLAKEHFSSLGLLQAVRPQDDRENLIINYSRRLQKLKEQKAIRGINTPPETLIEIEDIEAEIEKLQTELNNIADLPANYSYPDDNNILSTYDDNDEKPQSAGFTNELYNFYIDQVSKLSSHNSSLEDKARQIRALSLERFKKLDGKLKGDALKFLYDSNFINGSDTILNLTKVDLSGADLKNIDLRGVDLRGVDLSKANLQEADLRQADLSNANLREAILTKTNLKGAKLNETQLPGVDLSTVNLIEADLVRANLTEANLSGAKLGGTNLTTARLVGANLKRVNLDIIDQSKDAMTCLSSALLSRADLSEANLIGVDLSGARLHNANLSSAIMSQRWVTSWGEEWTGNPNRYNINRHGLKLRRTNLFAADLSKANLSKANLLGADLRKADLSEANLTDTYLAWADFTGANLTGAKVTSEQLEQARSLKHARMPDGEIYTPTFESLFSEVFNKTLGTSVLVGLGTIGLFRNCWGLIAGVIIGIACFLGLLIAYNYTNKILGVRWIALWGTILNAIWGGTVFAILGGITGGIALIIIGGLWGLLQYIYSVQEGLRGVSEVIDWIRGIDINIILFSQLFALAGLAWGGIEGYYEGIYEYSSDNVDTKSAIKNILLWATTGMLLGGVLIVGLGSITRSEFAGDSIFIWMIFGAIVGIIKGLHKTIKRYLTLKEEEGYWKLYL